MLENFNAQHSSFIKVFRREKPMFRLRTIKLLQGRDATKTRQNQKFCLVFLRSMQEKHISAAISRIIITTCVIPLRTREKVSKMKNFVFVLIFVFALFTFSFAQSGRKGTRVENQPVPSQTPAVEDDSNYSDSSLRNKQSTSPSFRREPGVASPQPTQEPGQSSAGKTVNDDDEVLRVETNLVTVPVSVFDRNGRYIPSLRQEDFKVFENAKEQEVAYFGTTEQPFTVVLLLDTSPSTEYKIDEIRDAAISFVNQLKPQDKVMVVEFDQNIHVLAEPTNDRDKLYKAIRRADFGGGTSLYEAVDFALRKRLNVIDGRKAIVLFTDGVDTTSYKASYENTVRFAEESEAQIFPIYYDTYKSPFNSTGGVMTSPYPPIFGSPFPGGNYPSQRPRGTSRKDYAIGKEYLEELALKTAGQVFPASANGGLEGAFAGIAEALRRQYILGYYPQEGGQAGQRKQIKVRVARPNLVVKARDSYIVGATESGNTNAGAPPKLNLTEVSK